MKSSTLFSFVAVAVTSASLRLGAQTLEASGPLRRDSAMSHHRISASFRAGFNVGVSLSGRNTGASPGAATGGTAHTYDNGYVLIDDSNNANGKTWNWGYDSDSQLVGDNLVFSASQPGAIANDDESGTGFELLYAYRIGSPEGWNWGIESAFNFMNLGASPSSGGALIVDSYATGGIVVPGAPYAGSATGPGPLLSDTPTRLVANVSSDLDANLYGFRFGPYLEMPFSSWGSLVVGGGVSFVVVDSDVSYLNTAVVPGAGTYSAAGSASDSDLLVGGYLSAGVLVRFTDHVNMSVALQYQKAGSFSQEVGDKLFELDLSQSVFVTAGIGFSF